MSKFRIKMKLTGLELEIEGSRDDMPHMTQQLGRQFIGLLQPAANIVAGGDGHSDPEVRPSAPILPPNGTENGASLARKKAGRKRRVVSGGSGTAPAGASGTEPVEFTHDPTRFGAPKQDWNALQKSLWLLYIVSEQADRRELTAHQIEATFNRHFREAGQVLVQHVARDLGKARAKGKDAFVAEDATMDPSPWYLTEQGRRAAQELVAQALGRSTDTSGDGAAAASGAAG